MVVVVAMLLLVTAAEVWGQQVTTSLISRFRLPLKFVMGSPTVGVTGIAVLMLHPHRKAVHELFCTGEDYP